MMQSWNDLVHVAMIGTGKRSLNDASLPEELKSSAVAIKESFPGQEDQFLAIASIVFNYRQCGVLPFFQNEAEIIQAKPEELLYASDSAHLVLYDIIQEESTSLLYIWLQKCCHHNQIVQPDAIPVLMEIAVKNKGLQSLVKQCTGKRGEWLASFHEQWLFGAAQNEEELWQTGTLEQRKHVLQSLRKRDPEKGLALIQSVWPQENAATKAELLKILKVGLNPNDVSWLETLLTEKSEKVKVAAIELLKSIPSSIIVQQYCKVLQQSITFKEGRRILGIKGKSSMTLELPAIFDQDIFKTGIEKLSNQKHLTDSDYIIFQLIKQVPPQFWQEWLRLDLNDIIALFETERNKKYLPALGSAAVLFANADWLRGVIKANENEFYPAVLALLPQKEMEAYAMVFLASNETAPRVIEELTKKSTKEWSFGLTKTIFQFTGKRPYQYHQAFYKQNIHIIPLGIDTELDQCSPPDEYSKILWCKTTEYIRKLLKLKGDTLSVFN